jgi:glycosyltransferase involved in cell wall biosynthesis
VIISNGADTVRFRPGLPVSSLGQATSNPYAVFFGALSKWQGIPCLVAAASDRRWPQGLDLVIAGKGADEFLVRTAAKTYPHVHYVGSIPYEDVAALVSNAMASLIVKEGDFATGLMPLKLFESMACGVPVVVTDYPGIADVVKVADAGFVIPPGDVDALVSVLNTLTESPERGRAMGRRGRVWVNAGHSWDARAGETSECLSHMRRR